ncbi:MAG: tetratricopeptide repeat protein [Bdellovibrionales bacterium]
MKPQNWIFTILISLAAAQAPGALAQAGQSTADPGIWAKMTTTVKTTVKRWMDYWTGSETVPSPAAAEKSKAGTQSRASSSKPPVSTAPGESPSGGTQPSKSAAVPLTPRSAPPAASPENVELRKLPLFEPDKGGSGLQDVNAVHAQIKSKKPVKVVQPGRKGTSKLPRSKAGVPLTDWKNLKVTKRVPRLDIGIENEISREDFQLENLTWTVRKPSEMKRLAAPQEVRDKDIRALAGIKVPKALGPRGLQASLRTVGTPLTHEQVEAITYTIQDVPDYKALPYKPLSEEHLKMVAALILFEKGNHCHMIMGLFNQLAETPKTHIEATYHLGACADQLKMHQAAFDRLSKVVSSEDAEFGADALALLAKDLPLIYEDDFYKVMKRTKNPKKMITEKAFDDVAYRMAKGAYRSRDYKTSITYADVVSDKSSYFDDARFLSAMNSFALADKKTALKKLETLYESLESRKVQDSNILALTNVNLARMYFSQKIYDRAFDHYMKVPKDHPLWVQALIEQGWTQLALEDFAGAIGNMYSLHSPYFKAVYQPESFVVRTIGYLNICQYGDAYRTLSWLEKDYRDWFNRTTGYLTSKSQPLTIYGTVKSYIQGKSTDDVDGVPHQVWREMARRKDFLNMQTALNEKQDETKRYEGVNEAIKKEKAGIRTRATQAKKRFDKWKGLMLEARKNRSETKEIDRYRASLKLERDLTIGYRFQLAILEQSRQGYLAFQKNGQERLDKESDTLMAKAGEILLKRAQSIKDELSRLLENNEFLRYEVFAGSGENIRYQVAGGEVGTPNRVPAHIKPTKMMNWNFDGEFWEDEIGSYRSSLQNACPNAEKANDQASLGN